MYAKQLCTLKLTEHFWASSRALMAFGSRSRRRQSSIVFPYAYRRDEAKWGVRVYCSWSRFAASRWSFTWGDFARLFTSSKISKSLLKQENEQRRSVFKELTVQGTNGRSCTLLRLLGPWIFLLKTVSYSKNDLSARGMAQVEWGAAWLSF